MNIFNVMENSHIRRYIILFLISREDGVGMILTLSQVCKKFKEYLKDNTLYQLLRSKLFHGVKMKNESVGDIKAFKSLWGIYIRQYDNYFIQDYNHKYGVHPDLKMHLFQRTIDSNRKESPMIIYPGDLSLIKLRNDDFLMADLFMFHNNRKGYKLGDYPFSFLRAIHLDGYKSSSMFVNSSIETKIKEHMDKHPNSIFEITIDGLKFIFDEHMGMNLMDIHQVWGDIKRKYTNFYTDKEDGINTPIRMIRIFNSGSL